MKKRRRRNHISSISTSRGIVNSLRKVKEEVRCHFEKKFRENCRDRPTIDGVNIISLSQENRLSLEVPFLEEEIKEAIWSCDGSKNFHSGAVLSKSITPSFLTLIPKKSNPLGLDDYRMICLVGCIYKIISKLLACRIKKVLS
ncbi:uncharacterized protein LOC131597111 [Vicia villosa]|uniref:uncharacterized protein LOC131597111 n=1 Tax=Vicia villosa TaxID=3911 RepID=UPI00273BD2DA|nr:uncharacterized protein LOC131597111 [Vicia villosa]